MVCKQCWRIWKFVKNWFSRGKQRYKCTCWRNQSVANYYDNPSSSVVKIIVLTYYTLWIETKEIAIKLWVSNSTVKSRLHEFWDFYHKNKSRRNLKSDVNGTKIISWVLPSKEIIDEILLHKWKRNINLYLNYGKDLIYFSQDTRILKHLDI